MVVRKRKIPDYDPSSAKYRKWLTIIRAMPKPPFCAIASATASVPRLRSVSEPAPRPASDGSSVPFWTSCNNVEKGYSPLFS